jgi:hypothetical protein
MHRVAGYEVLEELPRVSAGVTYKARHPETGQVVVLKPAAVLPRTADPDENKRFHSAAAQLARLEHPNVVRLLGVAEEGDQTFLVLEYVEGRSLAERLRGEGPLPAAEAARVLVKLAEATAAAHRQGILHGELKPSHVLFATDGTPKLGRFRPPVQMGVRAHTLTASGTLVGTPDYLAPEQVAGRVEALGPATDVWGLGVVLYQTLTGRPPFHGSSPTVTMARVLHEEPTAPHLLNPSVPPQLEAVCLRCLQKDPARRYASPEELAGELSRFLVPPPPQAVPAAPPGSPTMVREAMARARRDRDDEEDEEAPRKPRRAEKPRVSGAEMPGGVVDPVVFTVTAPPAVAPGTACVIDVWAHFERQRREVLDRARDAAGGDVRSHSKGPVPIGRGTVLTVRLKVEDLVIDEPEDTVWWDGRIGNATFPVTAPAGLREGPRKGVAGVYVRGLQVARVHFVVQVGPAAVTPAPLDTREERHRKAFASYASADRDSVLPRIQGIQKAVPGMQIFFDVASLRSGQYWEKELWKVIPANDVFYLFWSANARASEWVEKEWRCALSTRGLDFIDPVPLEAPNKVPPPKELAEKHFNDWVLAFLGGRQAAAPEPFLRRLLRGVRGLVGLRG